MKSITKFVGLDVSRDKIAVAVAERGAGAARYLGVYPNTLEAVRKLLNRLGRPEELHVCYEAGVTGYGLARFLRGLKTECMVVAPSKIPLVPGPRVKTDRKDAVMLAERLRTGDLVSVWVPDEADEALRDLVRARKARMEDLKRAKQRVNMLLLRHGITKPEKMTPWSERYRAWLRGLELPQKNSQAVLQEYIIAVEEVEQGVRRLEQLIQDTAANSPHAPVIQALQALRGVQAIAAATIVAEVGDFTRFAHPEQLMAYAGMTPRESSSGDRVSRGGITKTGSPELRWICNQIAHSYRYSPKVAGDLARRLEGLSPEIQAIAWKAQIRLHKKLVRLMAKGKCRQVAVTAVARELLGFAWAIGQKVGFEMAVGKRSA
jgi:transposase